MISGDSSLSEKVKDSAKDGAKYGAMAGLLLAAGVTAISCGADDIHFAKEFGIPGYVGLFAFMETFVISAHLLVEVSAHYVSKAKDGLVEYVQEYIQNRKI